MDDLAQKIRDWLGEPGIKFFRQVRDEHGTLNAVLTDGPIPHPVHFREGMQVRNKLRDLTNNSWTAHEYDDRWEKIVLEAIKEQ